MGVGWGDDFHSDHKMLLLVTAESAMESIWMTACDDSDDDDADDVGISPWRSCS